MPPTNNGTFLDKPTGNDIASADPTKQHSTFYKDSRVVAYRLPDGEMRLTDAQPVITTSSPIATSALYDGKIAKNEVLTVTTGTSMAWVQFAFVRPYTAKAISIAASPVATGLFSPPAVGSTDQSDRFLWDFRNTISDLIAENHYATTTDYLHKRGIKVYGEAIGAALGTMGDGLKSKGRVDIPMCEFWTENPDGFRDEHLADVLEAASAAHIYDKTIVACEAFTDIKRPFGPPAYLKYVADHYMALGVNRFVIHTSVHQPLDDKKPGLTLAIFGQHYTRQNTWAEQSVAWNSYLSRSSYLLQQGKSVSDIAYFMREDAPAVSPFWEKLTPAVPNGYKVDLVNMEVILTRMRVENGQLVLPDGVRYRVLVLPDKTRRMTLPLLRKIRELVAAGAVLIGPKQRVRRAWRATQWPTKPLMPLLPTSGA